MAISGGLGSQAGISVVESTYSTFQTITRFIEFNSESLNYVKNIVQGQGLYAGGSVARASRRTVTTTQASGNLNFNIPNRGFGLPLAHAMGSYPTVSAGTYTFTLGSMDASSFTTQIGLSQTASGTVTPKNLTGCKITSWTIAVPNGGIATMDMAIDASGFETSTALATASYPSAYSSFHFAQGAIKLDGSTIANVRDFSLTVDNGLKTDRFNLGLSGKKSAQVHNTFRKIAGAMTAEFVDTVLLAKFTGDVAASLELTLTSGTGEILDITLPVVYFDADTPKVSGPNTIDMAMTFEGLNSASAPLTIVYTTADSSL